MHFHINIKSFLQFFNKDSIGDKFYIILEGTVGVYIYNESKEMICVKKLMKGSSFGELALLYESPRMATIICLENSHFAVLQKKEFLRVLKNEQKEKLNKKLLYLQGLPLFQRINQQLLRQIYSKAFDITTAKDQIIFKQGDLTQNFYIVKSGEFSVKHSICESQESDNDMQGLIQFENKELSQVTNVGKQKSLAIQVALLAQSDYFGEEDILRQRQKRSLTVECMTASGEIIMVQKPLFIAILDEYHSNIFLKERLKIKEKQYQDRLTNARKLMRKFKSFLVEDRFELKSKKQIEEEQNIFQKNIMSNKSIKQTPVGDKKTILTKINDSDLQLQQKSSNQNVQKEKKPLKTIVIDEEQKRALDDKIQHLIQLKGMDQGKKPKLPTYQDFKEHNQKYGSPKFSTPKSQKQIQIKSPLMSDVSFSENDSKISESGSQNNTPKNSSPSMRINDKAYLLKIFQQKPLYKQSRFHNDSNLFEKYQNQNMSNDEMETLNLNDCTIITNIITIINQKQEQSNYNQSPHDNNTTSMINKRLLYQKNQSLKLSFHNSSSTNLENSENPRFDQNTSLVSKKSNQNPIIIGRISELGRSAKLISHKNQLQIQDQSYSQDQLFNMRTQSVHKLRTQSVQNSRSQKIVSFSQNTEQNVAQTISSNNDSNKIIHDQKLVEKYDDNVYTKFAPNYINRSQERKLTEPRREKFQSIDDERRAIEFRLKKQYSKNENQIDNSADDQKRQLINQLNTLYSPKQIEQISDIKQTIQAASIPRQNSQPQLRQIDQTKSELNKSITRVNQNYSVNGSFTDYQKRNKSNDINAQSFQPTPSQMNLSNLLAAKIFENSSLIFRIDYGNSRCNSLYNSPHNSQNIMNNSLSTSQYIAPNMNNCNNIHTRKATPDQNKTKPIKMNIRFQNLFKNH